MAAIFKLFLRPIQMPTALGEELSQITQEARNHKLEIEKEKAKEKAKIQEAEAADIAKHFGSLPANSQEIEIVKKLLEHNRNFFQQLPDACRAIAQQGYYAGEVGTVPRKYRYSPECSNLRSDLKLLSDHESFKKRFPGIELSAHSHPKGFLQCTINASWPPSGIKA